MELNGLPRKFDILCAHDLDTTRFLRVHTTEWVKRRNGLHQVYVRGVRAKGEAEVRLICENRGGIPIPRIAVMFDFEGNGQPEESKLVSVQTDSAGSVVALVVERFWESSWNSFGSHKLYTDIRTALADHKTWRAVKANSRRNEEELRWSDENPPLSGKEAMLTFEERRRMTTEERLQLGDQSSPVWRAYAASILGTSPEPSSMAFEACPFCVARDHQLENELHKMKQ